jgi:tRNA 2-selenouridine synthase
MKDLSQISDLRQLFVNETPLLDVRASVEYIQGAFPNTQNHPLLNDKERELIGIRYKEQGQDAAVALGAKLISDEIKDQRVGIWEQFVRDNPKGVLYCFRGGMRSKITQQWIYERTGIAYPRVHGGYKAMRRFLIEAIERIVEEHEFVVLGGRTGSGKTRLLYKLNQAVDLEGLANHRGSAFGPSVTPQPTQINFENNLAIELLKQEARQNSGEKLRFIVEDEGRNIGCVHLPKSLHEKMSKSTLIILDVSDEERVNISLQEYAIDMPAQFNRHYGEELGFEKYQEYLLGSITKIRKRLGGERFRQFYEQAEKALKHQRETGDIALHIPWVKRLLLEYYDPMYDYQLSGKQERIAFRGDRASVVEYLSQITSESVRE